ncbi:MAG: fibrillarin-like rRNA/tRNA 2'-O-methyltransferase [Candidatus Aenigmarchaeota archaeon]|nr:fibrillarin-like rRNA/tRNA 2'-O-methyltransferase [Candidatus Aenigmarchaeota archaeon]
MREIFNGIFKSGKKLYTQNLIPGEKVYGENLIRKGKKEYREWSPERSKLAAAILNGLNNAPLGAGTKVLYLGASTGTTCSHISDIVGRESIVYAVEFAERVFRELVKLAEKRKNICPILADARKPQEYDWIEEVDVVYCDVAQPDETKIVMRNAEKFLKAGGWLMLAVKARSIDVTKKPKEIYEEEKKKLEKEFEIINLVELEPFEKDHCFILARKKS